MKKSRNEILSINPAFTKYILDLQLRFKPEPYEEGDRVDSILFNLDGDGDGDGDGEGTAILTKEIADKLNIEQNEEFERNRDKNPFPNSINLDFIESYLIISSKENSEEYLSDIARALEKLRIELDESNLIVLGVENTPWLVQENDYQPAKNALDYLKGKIDTDFNGGFLLKKDNLIEFIPHLFWLVRCNASLTYFYMTFPKAKTFISLCKYGVLHFECYDQNEKIRILQILSNLKFKELDRCGDPIEFDNFDGRQIMV